MTKAVKLSDIAEKLNVSTVTVSKGLSGKSGVSDELRAEIKRLAEEMGYKPPSSKQSQKESICRNIGVIVSEIYLEKFSSFYWELYREIAEQATKFSDFSILEVLKRPDEDGLILPKIIQEKRVDGVIVLGKLKSEYLDLLKNKKIPLVFLDFYDKEFRCDCVISNNFYGMYKITNYLFDCGHKKIAFVGSVLATSSIADRYFGYCKSLLEHGIELRKDWVLEDRNMESGKIETILLPDEMPSAFVCNCDYTAGVLIRILSQKGYEVPKDISVVGFDNYIYPGLTDVEITTYDVDMKEMAKISVNLIRKRINHEKLKTGIHTVEGHIIVKDSVSLV